MLSIRGQVSLRELNTFGIDARCDHYTEISSIADFNELLSTAVYQDSAKLILGGGSNILFRGDFKGIVVKNNLLGREVVSENESTAVVRAAAGEIWHELVLWCIGRGYGGVENLSLIPGCVGAGPMQNIGAYGVELKEVFEELEAIDIRTGEARRFSKSECGFGYRESVFKNKYRDRYLITSVTLRLSRRPKVNISYGAIRQQLEAMEIKDPTIRDVSDAVIRIRQSKLPDPKVTGNAGSFFKNPEVSEVTWRRLKDEYPEIVAYPLDNGSFKLAAGWLIERAGMKGFEYMGAAVHTKQALVLVNRHNCTGEAVYRLSEIVLEKVKDQFGVMLEREVNIVG